MSTARRTFNAEFPRCFAIYRDSYSNDETTVPRYSFQFLDSRPSGQQYDIPGVLEIENARWSDEMLRTHWYELSAGQNLDITVYTIAVAGQQPNVRYFKYWYLPFYFPHNGRRIPVIEFQYKSWLPSPIHYGANRVIIPMNNRLLFLQTVRRINSERQETIRYDEEQGVTTPVRERSLVRTPPPVNRLNRRDIQRESNTLHHILNLPIRDLNIDIRRGPLFSNLRVEIPLPREDMISLEDLQDDEEQETPNLPLAFREHIEPERAVPPRALSLPRHVGDLLLQQARTGTESCPISALRYSECTKLSVTSCFHVFESQSIQRWRTLGNNNCPVCRTSITNIVTE